MENQNPDTFFNQVNSIVSGQNKELEVRTFGGTLVNIVFTNGRPGSDLIGYIGDNIIPQYWDRNGLYFAPEYNSTYHLKLVPIDPEGEDSLGWVAVIKTSMGNYEATPLMTLDEMNKFNHEGIVAKKKILIGEGL